MVALVVALGQANSVVSVVVALALGTVRTRASTPLLGPSNTRKRATPQMLSLLSYTGSSAVAVLWMEMLSFLMLSLLSYTGSSAVAARGCVSVNSLSNTDAPQFSEEVALRQ